MLPMLERYQGAMVGNGVGDAVAAPWERMYASAVLTDLKSRNYDILPCVYPNPFRPGEQFPGGRPTDDSELSAVLGQSLVDNDGLDEDRLYDAFRVAVVDRKSILWNGKADGFGRTTRTIFRDYPTFTASRSFPREKIVGSNGSLMRTIAVILRYLRDPGRMTHMTRRASLVTHLSEESGDACVIYATILRELVYGANPKEAIDFSFRHHIGTTVFSPAIMELKDRIHEPPQQPGPRPDGKDPWHVWGSAWYSLHTACYLLSGSRSFEEVLEGAIRRGGDTDTYAAIACGLAGAQYGLAGIPQRFRDYTIGAPKLWELGSLLYNAAFPGEA